MQAQRLSKPAGKVKAPKGGAKAAPRPQDAQVDLQVWVQTPSVQPGDRLAVDLLVSLVNALANPDYAFRILSRSVEYEAAPSVIAKSSVHIVRPSLFRRLLPYASILIITAGILAFAVWLASTGVLG